MNKGKILIGCEQSQTICKAFRAQGYTAFSCDIVSCTGGCPHWHIKDDIFKVLAADRWDMLIVHPPCTYLCSSGNRWYHERRRLVSGCKTGADRERERDKAVEFFMRLTATNVPRWCIENPVGIMSSLYRPPNQIIQPWMYGHGETKATCLWLRNLPRLNGFQVRAEREERIKNMPGYRNRTELRSKTFAGVAAHMAEQWGHYLRSLV